MIRAVAEFFGIETGYVSHTERVVSALGGLVGIALIIVVTRYFLPDSGSQWIIASMGSSAVLLYAVPHGALSQPWSVLGGHLVSAVIGVTSAQYISNDVLAPAVAVAGAIGAMHYLRCIHPPGGATALGAVVGGESIRALGFEFVLAPVMINTLIIFSIAILYNALFKWRRYPAALQRWTTPTAEAIPKSYDGVSHADLVYALSEIDSFIDVTEQDLMTIYDLAMKRHALYETGHVRIEVGRFYSNGRYGSDWSVRQIVDSAGKGDPDADLVIYKTVAGAARRTSGTCSRSEFVRWAQYEVERNENSWQRVALKNA